MTMNEYKQELIFVLLDMRLGEYAERVYHDDDPAEIREGLRNEGYLQGGDNRLAEAMWDWVADDIGADELL